MVVNSLFEDLEGGVGLKRVWEFVPEVGKKRNERVRMSRAVILDFGSSPEVVFLVDFEHPEEI